MTKKHEEERERFETTLKTMQSTFEKKEKSLYADVAEKTTKLDDRLRQCDETILLSKTEQEKSLEERRLLESRLNAMRFEHGLIKDKNEFTSKASFEELEHQYRTLQRLFKQEWRKVKKDIRARIVWSLFKRGPEPTQEEKKTETANTANTTDTTVSTMTPAEQMVVQSLELAMKQAGVTNLEPAKLPTEAVAEEPAQQTEAVAVEAMEQTEAVEVETTEQTETVVEENAEQAENSTAETAERMETDSGESETIEGNSVTETVESETPLEEVAVGEQMESEQSDAQEFIVDTNPADEQ